MADPDLETALTHEAVLERLMVLYQQADPSAAAALIQRLSPRLYNFFAAQLGNRAEADDMLQELWLRIHRVRHTYRPGQPLLPWAYAIAHRVRIDCYRRRRRLAAEIAVDSLPEPAMREGPHHDIPTFEELVATLPDSQREVLTMLKVDGLSVGEIARATASTEGSVKQKAHRAYERLRTLLGPKKSSQPIGAAP